MTMANKSENKEKVCISYRIFDDEINFWNQPW